MLMCASLKYGTPIDQNFVSIFFLRNQCLILEKALLSKFLCDLHIQCVLVPYHGYLSWAKLRVSITRTDLKNKFIDTLIGIEWNCYLRKGFEKEINTTRTICQGHKTIFYNNLLVVNCNKYHYLSIIRYYCWICINKSAAHNFLIIPESLAVEFVISSLYFFM